VAAASNPPPTKTAGSVDDPLAPFGHPVAAWFRAAFEAPTPAQVGGWASISAGRHTLIHAPTGSGKTLAAFLWSLDRMSREPRPRTPTVRVLYISPLKDRKSVV
jgi:ATP-dependent Lhr-like helicase